MSHIPLIHNLLSLALPAEPHVALGGVAVITFVLVLVEILHTPMYDYDIASTKYSSSKAIESKRKTHLIPFLYVVVPSQATKIEYSI